MTSLQSADHILCTNNEVLVSLCDEVSAKVRSCRRMSQRCRSTVAPVISIQCVYASTRVTAVISRQCSADDGRCLSPRCQRLPWRRPCSAS